MFELAGTVIMKVTRDCNLRCDYCYVKNKDNFKGEKIDFELFKTIIAKIVKGKKIADKPNEFIQFVFHGGEPTIIGIDYLAKLLHHVYNEFNNNNINFSIGMQTNLTTMTEDMAILLHKYNVSIGVSFDGIKDGNSARTKFFSMKDYNKKFNILKKYNLSYGFLFVANQKNINVLRKSFKFMDKIKIQGYKVNFAEDVNNLGNSEITGKQYFEVVYKYFVDEFIKHGRCKEENTQRLINRFLYQSLTHTKSIEKINCGGKFCGAGLNIVEIEPDGNILYCGRFSQQYPEAMVGNAVDDDFLSLKQIRRYTDFVKEKHDVIIETNCDSCVADGMCDYGCMAFHYSKLGTWGIRKDLVCDAILPLYKYLSEHEFDLLLSLYENNKDENGRFEYFEKIKFKNIKINNVSLKKLSDRGISVNIDKERDQYLIFEKIKK